MPYGRSFRRKTYKKKRSFRRPRTYKRKTYARIPPKVKRYVKSTINRQIETKYRTSDQSGLLRPIWDQSLVYYLDCWPTTGTGDTNRIGDKIKVSKITIWYEQTNFSTQFKEDVRLIFFQQKTTNNLGLNTILDPNFDGTTDLLRAPYTWDYKNQYHILKDMIIVHDESEDSTTVKQILGRKFTIMPKQKTIAFAASGTVPLNNIGVLLVSNKFMILSTNSGPYIKLRARVQFKDA